MKDPKTYADFPPNHVWRMLPGHAGVVTVLEGRIWLLAGGVLTELVPRQALPEGRL